jgi:CDP-glucose 4,6-dehydratase
MEGMEGLKGKKILVTGGTGFVGSHLVEALVKRGARVVVPYRSLDPQSYFTTQGLASKVVLAIGDVCDRRRMVDIVSKYEIEVIFHLAAQPIVDTAYNNPVETITTNVLGTLHLLDAAYNSGTVRQIIVTSSDKAYGKMRTIPGNLAYKEDHPLAGDHPYEASKSAADIITQSYIKSYKAPATIVRFGNIYGPGDLNESRIIPGIMHAAITGEELVIRSDGTFVRDYVYVKDVVSAYLFLLDHFDKSCDEAFNIASDTSLSVTDLIKRAEKILKTSVKYRITNIQKNEIPRQHLDWSKIARLGWKPEYTPEMAILETYAWYRNNNPINK